MGLSIKRAETERKARLVAQRMGVGVTEAIDRALERALEELAPDRHAAKRQALFARIRARGTGDGRSLQEIEAEMYGEGGEPV